MFDDIYKSFLENAPYPVWIIGIDKKYKYVNKFYRVLYNLGDIEIFNKNVGDIACGDLNYLFVNRLNEVILEKKVKIYEDNINGRSIQCIAFPLFDATKRIYAVSGIIVDFNYIQGEQFNIINPRNTLQNFINTIPSHKYYRDILTGLYNRTSFDVCVKGIENEKNLPIGVIMGDINGLKFINDTFGYSEGDKVLISLSNILKECCGNFSTIFRWGGDEFLIVIPNAEEEKISDMLKSIKIKCKECKYNFIELSVSFGYSIVKDFYKSLYDYIKIVEDKVYRHKLLEHNSSVSATISSLLKTLETKSMETEKHTERMIKGVLAIGTKMNLGSSQLDELVLATKLHDIGKIVIDENILLKPGKLSCKEYEIMKTHSEKGYRIVKALNGLESVAQGVLAHHERYDGKGYPMGLCGEEIPIISRIISVVDSYDAMTNDRVYKKAISKEEAIKELINCKGKQFDPYVVDCFVNINMGKYGVRFIKSHKIS